MRDKLSQLERTLHIAETKLEFSAAFGWAIGLLVAYIVYERTGEDWKSAVGAGLASVVACVIKFAVDFVKAKNAYREAEYWRTSSIFEK
jgi:hypothetical protein